MQLPYFEVAKTRIGEPDEVCYQSKNIHEVRLTSNMLARLNPTDTFQVMQVGFGEVSADGTIF